MSYALDLVLAQSISIALQHATFCAIIDTNQKASAPSLKYGPGNPTCHLASHQILFVAYGSDFTTLGGGPLLQVRIMSQVAGEGLPFVFAHNSEVQFSKDASFLKGRVITPSFTKYLAHTHHLDYLYFNLWLLKEILIRSITHQVILIQFGWPTVIPAAIMKKLGRCEWIAILGDSVIARSAQELIWSIRQLGVPLTVAKLFERVAEFARFIVVVNKGEADALVARGFDSDKVKCIPVVVQVMSKPRMKETPLFRAEFTRIHHIPLDAKLVAFHGDFSSPSNREAMEQVMEYVAPRTFLLDKKIFFLIIGRGVTPRKVSPNVMLLGFVPDLEMMLSNIDAEIVPLLHGSGMKTKILDAMNCAIPVITTKTGLSGFGSKCPLIVQDVTKFPDAIVELVNDETRLRELGVAGWKYVTENYSLAALSQYNDLVRQCIKTE